MTCENQTAVLGGAAQGAELVQGPGKRHGAVAAYQAVGGAQAGDTAERRGSQDGARCFRPDGEGHQAGGHGAADPLDDPPDQRERSQGLRPGPNREAAAVAVAATACQFHHGELADEHRADLFQLLENGGGVVEDLAA